MAFPDGLRVGSQCLHHCPWQHETSRALRTSQHILARRRAGLNTSEQHRAQSVQSSGQSCTASLAHLPHPVLAAFCRWFCPSDCSPVVFKMFSFCCLNVFACSRKALKCKVLCPRKHLGGLFFFFGGTTNLFNFGSLWSAKPGFSLCSP